MDLNTVIGFLLAFGLVFVAMALGPGGVGTPLLRRPAGPGFAKGTKTRF